MAFGGSETRFMRSVSAERWLEIDCTDQSSWSYTERTMIMSFPWMSAHVQHVFISGISMHDYHYFKYNGNTKMKYNFGRIYFCTNYFLIRPIITKISESAKLCYRSSSYVIRHYSVAGNILLFI